MRTRHAAAAVGAALLTLTATACSSSDDHGDAKAGTPPAATTTTPAPAYEVYRNAGGGTEMGIADLLLPDATEATARAAIQDYVRKISGSVGYSVQVVRTKVATGTFVCQGQWRKDAHAAAAYGGTQGLTISCPNP